jgi:hypothetical protein
MDHQRLFSMCLEVPFFNSWMTLSFSFGLPSRSVFVVFHIPLWVTKTRRLYASWRTPFAILESVMKLVWCCAVRTEIYETISKFLLDIFIRYSDVLRMTQLTPNDCRVVEQYISLGHAVEASSSSVSAVLEWILPHHGVPIPYQTTKGESRFQSIGSTRRNISKRSTV